MVSVELLDRFLKKYSNWYYTLIYFGYRMLTKSNNGQRFFQRLLDLLTQLYTKAKRTKCSIDYLYLFSSGEMVSEEFMHVNYNLWQFTIFCGRNDIITLFGRKSANQPAVFFSHTKSAPAISH